LHYPTHVPTTALQLQPSSSNLSADVFSAISRKDVLLHHPYESFATSVQAFLEQAADRPRRARDQADALPHVGRQPDRRGLIDAAESGKQVLALVEIKARFDEQANISWARKLEKAGVHVVYGLVGPEDALQARARDPPGEGRTRHYSHIGTGKLQPEDEPHLRGPRAAHRRRPGRQGPHRLFNELSGYAIEKKFKRLLVAPLHLRKGLLKLIAGEVRNAEAGRPRASASR
jgi:polyphosphate kinase